MSTRYWDRVAASWDEHIMCSLHEDISGNVESLLRSLGRTHRKILDFGCGVGGYLHLLSENFEAVTAVDTSRACVARAGELAADLSNVRVLSVNTLRQERRPHSFDALLMANVLLSPDPAERQQILRRALGNLRAGGMLVLVVPSTESVHLSETVRRRHLPRRRSVYSSPSVARRFDPGVVCIHGQPTKHHTADELRFQLRQEDLELVAISRVEYSWDSEGFDGLDDVVRERPWDWLVSARVVDQTTP